MKKLLIIAGTRPEIIKLAPLYLELKKKRIVVKLCFTGQHKELAEMSQKFFKIKANYNLKIMKKNQTYFSASCTMLSKFEKLFKNNKFDGICVQGDTITSMIGSIAAFFTKTPIFYIESGLRTFDKYDPYPEEINRKIISSISDYHFAPTKISQMNLIREGISKKKIYVFGNTVIDALKYLKIKTKLKINKKQKIIVSTLHRTENLNKNLLSFLEKYNQLAYLHKDWKFLFLVHPRKFIKNTISVFCKKNPFNRILFNKPKNYLDFINLISKTSFLITDSGGIQEEASFLGKFVFIIRKKTERPEILKYKMGKLLNVNSASFNNIISNFIKNKNYNKYKSTNIFGNGKSSQKIVDVIYQVFNTKK
jgi:UDP-N-acetylglucosamine 2-epimerase (non-hydrolysing)